MIIGVDHGYGYVKTKNAVFGSSVAKLAYQPPQLRKVVEYEGTYYQVGGIADGLAGDKTINDDYYILTLAAIAEELKVNKVTGGTIPISLAIGLPFTRYGREKDNFQSYLKRKKKVTYKYEGLEYQIKLNDRVYVYPQGLAAVMHTKNEKGDFVFHSELMDHNFNIVDMGTGTTELIPVNNGIIPDVKNSHTLQHGISTCVSAVNEELSRQFSTTIAPAQIINIILGEKVIMPEEALVICKEVITNFANDFLNLLRMNGINYEFTQTFFVGGGAFLLQNYATNLDKNNPCVEFITDIKANAIGYELLANSEAKANKGE